MKFMPILNQGSDDHLFVVVGKQKSKMDLMIVKNIEKKKE